MKQSQNWWKPKGWNLCLVCKWFASINTSINSKEMKFVPIFLYCALVWNIHSKEKKSVLCNIYCKLDKTNKMAYAPSEDLDQPGHPPSRVRVFAVHLKKAWVLANPLSAQQTLWSDWAEAQADLSLRCAHMPFCWVCHALAQKSVYNRYCTGQIFVCCRYFRQYAETETDNRWSVGIKNHLK